MELTKFDLKPYCDGCTHLDPVTYKIRLKDLGPISIIVKCRHCEICESLVKRAKKEK